MATHKNYISIRKSFSQILLTHNFWKLPRICNACLQKNDKRLYHFLQKWTRAALNDSLADTGKLARGSSLSILMTASSTAGLELLLLVELSAWGSRCSVSLLQNFNANLPLLAPEPIQFNQTFAAKNVNPSPSTLTFKLSVTVSLSGTLIALYSDSFRDHRPALVI